MEGVFSLVGLNHDAGAADPIRVEIERHLDGSVAIRSSASRSLVLFLLGAAVLAAVLLQESRDAARVGLGVLGSLVPFGMAAALDRSLFDFDVSQRKLRWRRANVFRTLSGELAFDEIADVHLRTRLETSSDSRRPRKHEVHRLVLATPAGELVLENAWTGDVGRLLQVADAIRGVLGRPAGAETPPDLDADIESLIAAGETVAAVRLVRTHLGLDLTEAKRWVDARRAPASPSPASGDI